MYGLATQTINRVSNDNGIDINLSSSKRSIIARCDSMLELLLTHNAAVGISQDFLGTFVDRLTKKNQHVKQHIQQLITPIVIKLVKIEMT